MNIDLILSQVGLILIALLANILSAFSGGGAGLIQLPALIWLGLPFSKALATHKLASVALGIGASIRHAKEKNLNRLISSLILFCGLPGVILGAHIVLHIPDFKATLALGILTLLLGIYSINNQPLGNVTEPSQYQPYRLIIGGLVLFGIGITNGSLSSGTGLFVTLWLVKWFALSYTEAIAYTLIFVGIFWNGSGAIFLGFNGEVQWDWLPYLIIGSLIGGYIGAHLSILKGDLIVKRAFELIAIAMGTSLIAKGLLY